MPRRPCSASWPNRAYRGRDEAAEGRFLLGQCYQLQKKFDQALATWRDYLTQHPAHRRWGDAQRMIVDTEYLVAAEQQAAKQYDQARTMWLAFLAKYPLDSRAPAILYLLGQMNFQRERWEDAIADWQRLVAKYPDTDSASAGQFMIALTLEEKLGKFDEAIKQYEKVTKEGAQKRQASARIARLTAKNMVIRTERVFRTDETPRIALVTRNIEKVTVRAYRIDLETYFRKMHLATGVEMLDTALIDPDRTFEFAIPDYAKYKQSESKIELPAQGESAPQAGVLVVTVNSDTLEATTMVLQTDLDILVKSSRDEVFVFAQNMRSGKPWPGVRLLISDGTQVFAEAQTGADGVFQRSYPQLKSAADVRVFAATENHSASNVVGLEGLGVARGLSDKGYVYTDRSAYRPGQMVNIRGVVRRVADDTYQIEEGKTLKLTVLDGRNRPVMQQEVRLNEFGTFHTHFLLPSASPQGDYRILLATADDRQQYQGAFSVHQYRLEGVHLLIESPRQVYYRGENIQGKITATYYYRPADWP